MDQQLEEKLHRPQTEKIILELKLIFQNKQTLRVNILEGRDFPYQYYAWIHITFVYRYIMAIVTIIIDFCYGSSNWLGSWRNFGSKSTPGRSRLSPSNRYHRISSKTAQRQRQRHHASQSQHTAVSVLHVTVKSWSKQTTIACHCCVSVAPIQGLDSKILFCFREWSVWKLPSGWTKI